MQFDVSHRIADVDPAAYERLYFDEAFNAELCAAVGLGRRLIRLDDAAGTVRREVEIAPDRQLPAPVARALGVKQFTYVETLTYAWGSGEGQWSTQSSVMADRIRSHGSLSIAQAGDGVLRRVWGEVAVRVFGLGGAIERAIVADVSRSYAEAVGFTGRYLQRQR